MSIENNIITDELLILLRDADITDEKRIEIMANFDTMNGEDIENITEFLVKNKKKS